LIRTLRAFEARISANVIFWWGFGTAHDCADRATKEGRWVLGPSPQGTL
jgi:hypothetical protein